MTQARSAVPNWPFEYRRSQGSREARDAKTEAVIIGTCQATIGRLGETSGGPRRIVVQKGRQVSRFENELRNQGADDTYAIPHQSRIEKDLVIVALFSRMGPSVSFRGTRAQNGVESGTTSAAPNS